MAKPVPPMAPVVVAPVAAKPARKMHPAMIANRFKKGAPPKKTAPAAGKTPAAPTPAKAFPLDALHAGNAVSKAK